MKTVYGKNMQAAGTGGWEKKFPKSGEGGPFENHSLNGTTLMSKWIFSRVTCSQIILYCFDAQYTFKDLQVISVPLDMISAAFASSYLTRLEHCIWAIWPHLTYCYLVGRPYVNLKQNRKAMLDIGSAGMYYCRNWMFQLIRKDPLVNPQDPPRPRCFCADSGLLSATTHMCCSQTSNSK